MEIFSRLFDSLNKGGVEYLVCGGIAVNLYGIERATADKEKTGRPQDRADVFYLKKIMEEWKDG